MTSPLQVRPAPHSEWALSLCLSATVGCLVATFLLVLIFYHFLAGLLYPVLAACMMKAAYHSLKRFQSEPEDPRHLLIQSSVIVGGLASVAMAYLVTGVIAGTDLLLAGIATAALAAFSIVVERFHVASRQRAADKAMEKLGRAEKLMEYGEHVNAQEELEAALLACELAHGSYHERVALIVTRLAELCQARERMVAARRMYERAVHVRAAISQSSPEFAALLQSFAEHLCRTGDYRKGYSVASQACVESRRVHGQSPATAYSLLTLSKTQEQVGKSDEAYKSSLAAIKILEKELGKSHSDTLIAKGLAANQCVSLGRLAEAERIVHEVLAAKQGENVVWDTDYLNLLVDLVEIQVRQEGVCDELVLRQAAEVYRVTVGPDYARAKTLKSRLALYLAEEAGPTRRGLYESLFAGQQSEVRKLIEADESLAQYADASGWTLLQWGVFFDQRDVVERLLSAGADLEYGRDVGLPALYIASRWRRKWVLSALERKKADVEVATYDGSRPIHGAVRSGDPLTFDTLMTLKPQLDQANARGWTALHEAVHAGHQSFLLELLSRGLDVNFQGGGRRESPLHVAIVGGYKAAVEALLLNGADVELQDAEGKTPVEVAQSLGRHDLLSLLHQHSAQGKESGSSAGSSGRFAALTMRKGEKSD